MRSKANGYVFALLAIVIFSIQDGISKHLGAIYPPVFRAMIRTGIAGFAAVIAARAPGGFAATAVTRKPLIQLLRASCCPCRSSWWMHILHHRRCGAFTGDPRGHSALRGAPVMLCSRTGVGVAAWSAMPWTHRRSSDPAGRKTGSFDLNFLLPLAQRDVRFYVITPGLPSRRPIRG